LLVLVGLYALLAVLLGNPVRAFQSFFADQGISPHASQDFVLAVVLAPLIEEAAKAFGVSLLGGRLQAARDGAMLGAAVGLGFAGVETFTYLLAAVSDTGSRVAGVALLDLVLLAGLRSVSAALLHPSATSLTGVGIARARLRGRSVLVAAFPFYLAAVVLHAGYNYLAGFLPPQDIGGFTVQLNLLAAILLAGVAWSFTKRRVAARA
jgi:RsiW-degrading membrane proteinase PrsW (M82 family)